MEKLMVIINGAGFAGKDQFISYCSDIKPVMNVSSIDHVKIALASLCPSYNIGDEKQHNSLGEKWRARLHELKMKSIELDDGPYKIVVRKIQDFLTNDVECILFVHIREPEEIKRILKHFKCKTMLFTNNRVEKITSNPADANVGNFPYDITIDNSGTLEDLREKAKDFMMSYS